MTPVVTYEGTVEPGVYDMPEDEYHADPVPGGSLSASGAKLLLPPSCPAKYRYYADHGRPERRVFDLGKAAHRLLLGTGATLEVVQTIDRKTGERSDARDYKTTSAQEHQAAIYAAGHTPLLRRELETAQAMADAALAHPEAGALFRPGSGLPERSAFWFDERNGITRRARFDWLPNPHPGRLILADYKGLALDTALPTPTGWTTMGAVQSGDQVIDSHGRPCVVTHKSEVHWRRCYRIRFDDGSSVVCDDEHLWLTTESGKGWSRRRGVAQVRTTDEIRRTLYQYGQRHHQIPVAAPLDLPAINLPVDPYVLGAWIGDGTAREGQITSMDQEVFDLIAARGYRIGPRWRNELTRTVYTLRTHLRKAGYLGTKQIPVIYQRASCEQRLDLLRGLMDTDGSWNPDRHQAVFTTGSKALAESVRELACGLGQRAIVHTYTAHGFGLTVEAYRVTFTPVGGLNPFALTRKASPVAAPENSRSARRLVMAVDEMPMVPTQCIAVDSPDSTYLCTEAMIPTHNTCDHADDEAAGRAIANYGYHLQGDWYLSILRGLGYCDSDAIFVLVFQERAVPYLVNVVYPDVAAMRIGAILSQRAINLYRECKASGVWPGYESVHPVSVPAYYENRFNEEW